LIAPPPDRVIITESPDLPERHRFALVPATPIPDHAAAVDAAEFALEACEAARVSDLRANLVAAAIAELSANALQHATGTVDPPVVAATVGGRERTLEVAVTDLGRGISEAEARHPLSY
jgi:anti-sigma regulatory factor (Ser/Thr protein kinase)